LPVKLAKTIKPTINALLYPANSNAATEWVRHAAAFGPTGQKCVSMWLTDGKSGRRGKGQGTSLFTPASMTTKLRI